MIVYYYTSYSRYDNILYRKGIITKWSRYVKKRRKGCESSAIEHRPVRKTQRLRPRKRLFDAIDLRTMSLEDWRETVNDRRERWRVVSVTLGEL